MIKLIWKLRVCYWFWKLDCKWSWDEMWEQATLYDTELEYYENGWKPLDAIKDDWSQA